MVKDILRFKNSILSGSLIIISLFLFILILFITLYNAQNADFTIQFDSRMYQLLKFTIYQAFLSTTLSLLVGLLLAWSLAHQSQFKGRKVLITLFSSSIVLPTIVVVFGIIGIFGRNGYFNQINLFLFDISFGSYLYGLSGILIAHVYLNASFAARSLLQSFESIPKEKYKLSKSLNFSIFKRFYYVEYPAIKSTLMSIGSTIFLLCFTSFAVVLLLGGSPSYNTLEVAIYEAVKLDFDITLAIKLAFIQITISAILVIISSSFQIVVSNLKASSNIIFWKDSKTVQLIQWFIIIVFSFFFILPLIVIIIDGIGSNFLQILKDTLFIKSLYTSIFIATISSIITGIIAIILSATMRNFTIRTRLSNKYISKFLNLIFLFFSNIYLAVPSLVMGLGFFIMPQTYAGSEFIWTISALITANILMSLPFAIAIINPLMQKTAKRYDKLSFSLGLTTLQRWTYVEYPYIKPSLGYVFALSFCFSLGDLGIISLFGSDEFTTLPWYLYQLMGSYRSTDAAGVALILLILVLTVFILLPKLFRNKIVKNN